MKDYNFGNLNDRYYDYNNCKKKRFLYVHYVFMKNALLMKMNY